MMDVQGLPVAAFSIPAPLHESTLVQQLFEFMLTMGGLERLIGGKACSSEKLDAQWPEMISPHRADVVRKT